MAEGGVMTPTWVILAVPCAAVAGYVIVREIRRRRADREWAAGIASRVHDRRYLDFLEEQFASEERTT